MSNLKRRNYFCLTFLRFYSVRKFISQYCTTSLLQTLLVYQPTTYIHLNIREISGNLTISIEGLFRQSKFE